MEEELIQENTQTIEERVASLEQLVSTIQNALGVMTATLLEIETTLEDRKYVTEAELRLWGNKMQNDITTAATTAATEVLNNITSTVEGHTSTLNTHTTNISNNTSNISSLGVRLDADETNISSAANTANSAKDKVDNIEENVIPTLATSASVTNLQNAVTVLSNTVSGHTDDIFALNENLDTTDSTATQNYSKILQILQTADFDNMPYSSSALSYNLLMLWYAINLLADTLLYPGQIWDDAQQEIPRPSNDSQE